PARGALCAVVLKKKGSRARVWLPNWCVNINEGIGSSAAILNRFVTELAHCIVRGCEVSRGCKCNALTERLCILQRHNKLVSQDQLLRGLVMVSLLYAYRLELRSPRSPPVRLSNELAMCSSWGSYLRSPCTQAVIS